MKTKVVLFCLLIAISLGSKAQTYVTIPDANFVSWLQTNYPTCMNVNQMDINCASIQSATSVNVAHKSISDLTGIQYFINLKILYCDSNLLTSLPALPNSLEILDCSYNQLTSLPTLPNSLMLLNCSNNQLTNLPPLPVSLADLFCNNNNISCFPIFPDLSTIVISANPFTCLPNYLFFAMDAVTLAYPLCVNGDLVNNPNGCLQTVSINENKADVMLSISPNPSNGKCYVNLSEGMNTSVLNIEVYNLLGELILNSKIQNSITQIDLSNQPNGIYIVRVIGTKQSLKQHVIKQ